MGNIIDKIILKMALFLLIFIIGLFIFDSIILNTLIALSITILLSISIKAVSSKKDKSLSKLKYFDTYMIVYGFDYYSNIIKELNSDAVQKDSYFIINNTILYFFYKFGKLSKDDIIKSYRTAKKEGKKEICIISNCLDKEAELFAGILNDVRFHFVKSKELYKILKNKELLPPVPRKITTQKIPLREIISIAFSRRNAPRFLLTSLLLLLLSYLTPLRNYYLILSAVSVILCIVTLIVSNKNNDTDVYNSDKIIREILNCNTNNESENTSQDS